jgi:eukaryotic-like serine/threonine-protein kinase
MRENIKKSFGFHLGIVLLLCIILYISFFTALHWLTRHGEEIKIPDVRGKNINEAAQLLRSVHFDIYVDSTYEPALKPLVVLKQVPDTGSVVKQGRTVFLTVNMVVAPQIPMPNLLNLSYRSAEMILRNNKLFVGDTVYKPDIAAGAILEQKFNGNAIRPGEMIAQGSKINLVIGDGMGNTEFNVPEVVNSSVDEAIAVLDQYGLQPVFHAVGEITDSSSAIVVNQSPEASNASGAANRVKIGQFIELTIEQNPSGNRHGNNTNGR